jgi:hypothetical protein
MAALALLLPLRGGAAVTVVHTASGDVLAGSSTADHRAASARVLLTAPAAASELLTLYGNFHGGGTRALGCRLLLLLALDRCLSTRDDFHLFNFNRGEFFFLNWYPYFLTHDFCCK